LRLNLLKTSAFVLAPAVIVVAGCGGRVSASGATGAGGLRIHASAEQIDTNGNTRYSATLASGEPAKVIWSVSGGDPSSGTGKITAEGVYTPPSYLTQESATVSVNAMLAGRIGDSDTISETAQLTITPGFLQPLTPGNLSLGPGGTVTVSGSMTEVGGNGGIRFTLASDTAGTPGAAGTLSESRCVRGSIKASNPAYTSCSVTYTAPAVMPISSSIFILGSVASNPAVSWTRILLNAGGISSNPVAHQARLAVPVQLGSSSGNNSDYDSSLGQLSDCCGGTLGSLLQDAAGTQYVLSNNHVLARSDQSIPGETIIQPGLIDNGCTPYGFGPGTTPVATLTGYPSLNSPTTNVDAAIARVTPGAVDPKGNILELGARQPDGTLSPAPPGISSTGGKGEQPALGMTVAKSGRTTGLTCASVSAINVDVVVDYYTDCAETAHALTKTFTNQIAIAGASFSDAGDSGALVVDTTNAEPVGLFFAGGTDDHGIEQAIASPVSEVLAALDTQILAGGQQTSYSFVGGQDHPVSCLNYGTPRAIDEATTVAAMSTSERERAEAALPMAQSLLNPAAGIVRVGITANKDYPGHAAIAVYVEPGAITSIPASIGNIPTVVLPANTQSVEPTNLTQPRTASMNQVLAAKQRNAAALLKTNPALFGVGVGQSLNNPADAALVFFVDRKKIAGALPETVEGQRVHIILMDRLHVTRSHGSPTHSMSTCRLGASDDGFNSSLQQLFEDSIPLPR